MATTYIEDESSTVWLKSTRTINSDDMRVRGYSMVTTYIHWMSHLLSNLKILLL